jgi:hypothetical protein
MPDLLITPSARVRRFCALRRRRGTDCLLNGFGTGGPPTEEGGDAPEGPPFRVITKPVAENLTGGKEVPVATLSVLIASLDSRVFEFSPVDFDPYTTLRPPKEKDIVNWHTFDYFLSHVTYGDDGPDTLTIYCYGLRMVTALAPV